MTRTITTIFLILFNVLSHAQELQAVQVLEEQSIYLNGTGRGYLGGQSRTYYKIDLPPNTVEWYYTFTTSESKSDVKTLGLISQLTRLVDPTGMTAIATQAITNPTGSSLVDVYLMDAKGKGYLMEKDALGAWKYDDPSFYEEGTTRNAKDGKVKIDDVRAGTVYLGIKNPKTTAGVNVTFEAVAIVDYGWPKESRQELFEICKTDFRDDDQFCNCLISRLAKNYTVEDIGQMAAFERDAAVEKMAYACFDELGIDIEQEELDKQKAEEDLQSHEDNLSKANLYGGLAQKAFEKNDHSKSLEYCIKALEYAQVGEILAKQSLNQLILGDEIGGIESMIEAIVVIDKEENAQEHFHSLMENIKALEARDTVISGLEEVKALIKETGNIKEYSHVSISTIYVISIPDRNNGALWDDSRVTYGADIFLHLQTTDSVLYTIGFENPISDFNESTSGHGWNVENLKISFDEESFDKKISICAFDKDYGADHELISCMIMPFNEIVGEESVVWTVGETSLKLMLDWTIKD